MDAPNAVRIRPRSCGLVAFSRVSGTCLRVGRRGVHRTSLRPRENADARLDLCWGGKKALAIARIKVKPYPWAAIIGDRVYAFREAWGARPRRCNSVTTSLAIPPASTQARAPRPYIAVSMTTPSREHAPARWPTGGVWDAGPSSTNGAPLYASAVTTISMGAPPELIEAACSKACLPPSEAAQAFSASRVGKLTSDIR